MPAGLTARSGVSLNLAARRNERRRVPSCFQLAASDWLIRERLLSSKNSPGGIVETSRVLLAQPARTPARRRTDPSTCPPRAEAGALGSRRRAFPASPAPART